MFRRFCNLPAPGWTPVVAVPPLRLGALAGTGASPCQTFRLRARSLGRNRTTSDSPIVGLERPTAAIAELGESVARTSSGMSYSPRSTPPHTFRDPVLARVSQVYNMAPPPGPETRPSSWSTRMVRDLCDDNAWEPLRSYTAQFEADRPPAVLSPRGTAHGWPQQITPGAWHPSLDRSDWLSSRSFARVDTPRVLGVSTYTPLGKEVENRYPPSGPIDLNPTRDRFAEVLSPRVHKALRLPVQQRSIMTAP